jgi:rhodanese-related sulfurtransferase
VRSATAAKILIELGFKVQSLKPGYEELLEAGFKKAEE